MGRAENIPQREILNLINQKLYVVMEKARGVITDGALYRINSHGLHGKKSTLPPGFPDLVGDITVSGVTYPLYVEVKAPGQTCRNKNQLQFLFQAAERGAIAVLTDSAEGFLNQVLEIVRSRLS